MKKGLEFAAKNTRWWHFGIRAVYFGDENGMENSMEATIFHESLMCAYYVRNLVIEELAESGAEWLLNRSTEYLIDKYSKEYPELCLILCNLGPFGPLSPFGMPWPWLLSANYIFGIFGDSPLYRADFYAKNIPVIRITHGVFTFGTNQPQFSTVADVKNYYRDKARIEEIARMCLFWIRKFYK